MQKQMEYRCLREGRCLVMRLNRNRCQYCRFKKCLAVGMSRDCKQYHSFMVLYKWCVDGVNAGSCFLFYSILFSVVWCLFIAIYVMSLFWHPLTEA